MPLLPGKSAMSNLDIDARYACAKSLRWKLRSSA